MTPWKIHHIKVWKEDLELTRPYTIAYTTTTAVENVFIYIETENGQYGIGAGSPSVNVTGESIQSCLTSLENKAEQLLLGQDIRHLPALTRNLATALPNNPAAQAAVDIALYDLYSKMIGLPLASCLGQVHQTLPTSITIGIKSIEESKKDAKEFLDMGFRILKVKTGLSIEKDVQLFSELRNFVGPDIKIRVDANQGYTPADLKQFYEQTRAMDVEFIEQPIAKKEYLKMLEVDEVIRKNCVADESLQKPSDALLLAPAPQTFGIFNIKLMKCGGIAPALSIAQIAHLAHIDLMWGCMDESIISITAALHAALACPATKYLDLDGSIDLARDIVENGFILKDGLLSVNDQPGLGVNLISKPK
jgi:L-alanine-DL-glutamate epimerase-like enolase superfamily enzyme